MSVFIFRENEIPYTYSCFSSLVLDVFLDERNGEDEKHESSLRDISDYFGKYPWDFAPCDFWFSRASMAPSEDFVPEIFSLKSFLKFLGEDSQKGKKYASLLKEPIRTLSSFNIHRDGETFKNLDSGLANASKQRDNIARNLRPNEHLVMLFEGNQIPATVITRHSAIITEFSDDILRFQKSIVPDIVEIFQDIAIHGTRQKKRRNGDSELNEKDDQIEDLLKKNSALQEELKRHHDKMAKLLAQIDDGKEISDR